MLKGASLAKVALGTVGLVLGLVGYLAYLQLSGNFHEVERGQVYRSAQPTADMIESFAADQNGKAILNLRGRSDGKAWYDTEAAAAVAQGLELIDFPMSASKFFSAENAEALIEVIRDAPKPLLIHCKSGSDRTGFASMVYLMALTDVGERKAEQQLSIRYGHFSVPYLSAAYPMDESWENFEAHIGLPDT